MHATTNNNNNNNKKKMHYYTPIAMLSANQRCFCLH